ncbi:MAG: hypothetical protein ABIK54_00670 [candidate division WOR-3 bacterium]
MKIGRVLLSVALLSGMAAGQFEFGVVCSTTSRFATGPSNSHKLAYRGEMLYPDRDTLTLVFQSRESIYYCLSGNGPVQPWSRPVALYPGRDPGITWGRDSDRHLVWVMSDTGSGVSNVYYRNLEFRMLPVNVSTSGTDCGHPDVYADSTGVAHVVWEEGADQPQIWYRNVNENGVIGGRFRVSTDSTAQCRFPAIECFRDTIYVIWQEFNPAQPAPYRIVQRRQVNGTWLPVQVLMSGSEPLAHPSLDFASGDRFSAAWEVCTGGNYDPYFAGGNGGGYHTAGMSTVPVVATVGTVWSYLFWQEDSAGYQDIYYNLYYFMTGWTRGTVRRLFGIGEPVRAPSGLGALAVWTQGDTYPYKVMWGFFGYPVGIEEAALRLAGRQYSKFVNDGSALFIPQPGGVVLDISGRRIVDLRPGFNDLSRLQRGVYFVRSGTELQRMILVR